MRIFKTKTLAKFTRQHGVSDAALIEAVDRAKRGLIDADLGGKIIKQRVARPGQGKRGGFRMLIGFGSDRAVYLLPLPRMSARTSAAANCSRCVKSQLRFWTRAKRRSSKQSTTEP